LPARGDHIIRWSRRPMSPGLIICARDEDRSEWIKSGRIAGRDLLAPELAKRLTRVTFYPDYRQPIIMLIRA